MHSRTVCPEPGVRNATEVCFSQPSCRSWDVGFGNIKNACGHLDSCSRVRGARRGIRTPTVTRWILSPVRLPIPPFSHDGSILPMQLHFLTGHRVKCQGKRGHGEKRKQREQPRDHISGMAQRYLTSTSSVLFLRVGIVGWVESRIMGRNPPFHYASPTLSPIVNPEE